MLKLSRITILNFMGLHDFTLFTSDRGVVTIVGDNGSGKSTIFEAMLWCLYGKTHKSLSVDMLYNMNLPEHNICVSVYFEPGPDGSGVRGITRARTLAGKTTIQVVYHEGGDNKHEKVAHGQAEIDSVLGVSFDLFCNAILFPQNPDLFGGLSDSSKMDLLEELLDVRFLDKLESIIKLDLTDLTYSEQNILTRLQLLEEQMKGLKEVIEEAPVDPNLQASLQRRHDNASYWHNYLQEFYSKIEERLYERKGDFKTLWDDKTGLLSEKAGLKEQLLRVQNKDCPWCLQKIDGEHAKTQMASIHDQLAKLDSKVDTISLNLATLQDIEENLRYELAELKYGMEDADLDTTAVCGIIKKVEILANQSSRVSTKVADKIRDIQQDVDSLDKELVGVSTELNDCQYWSRTFKSKQFKMKILDIVLKDFNSALATEAAILLETDTFTPSLAIDDKFRVKVQIRDADKVKGYAQISGGERRLVDVIISAALRKFTQTQFNVIFLDEVFENLDSSRMSMLLTYLAEEQNKESVFIISHRTEALDIGTETYRLRDSQLHLV